MEIFLLQFEEQTGYLWFMAHHPLNNTSDLEGLCVNIFVKYKFWFDVILLSEILLLLDLQFEEITSETFHLSSDEDYI